jgi:ribonuclease BN (tRNA processing enzyme)
VIQLRVFGLLIGIVVVIAGWILTCAAWQTDQVTAGVVPLDPRSFESLTVIALGTGGAYENPSRLGPVTGIALGDRVVLVDAGRGVSESLRRAKIPTSQPDTVLLTSLMPENTVGLDDLLMTGWIDGRDAPLRVVGPPGTAALVDGLLHSYETSIRSSIDALGLPAEGARLVAVEIDGDWSSRLDTLEVEATRLPGGPTPALAWRFTDGRRKVAVGTVGWGTEALVAFARDADLLVHDAAFIPTPEIAAEIGLDVPAERLERERAIRTPLDAVGNVARLAKVARLALVRLRPPPVWDLQITMIVDDDFDGKIWIPSDGDELTF